MKNEIEVSNELNEELEVVICFRHIKTGLCFNGITTGILHRKLIRDLSNWLGNFIYARDKEFANSIVYNRDKNKDFGGQNETKIREILERSDKDSFYVYMKNSDFTKDLWNIENIDDYKIEKYINYNFTKEFNSFICEILNKKSEEILEFYLGTKYLADFMLNDVACKNGIYGSIADKLK